jgi:predicted dehydrogenase
MRVAVIGCGSIGRRHIRTLLAGGCDAILAFDVDQTALQRAKAEYPAVNISGAAVAVDEGCVDALVIATPWHAHLEWVERAVGCGLAFFVEKPLGSLEQIPRWRQIAAMDLQVNQVGYQCRFHPKAQAMKSLFPAPVGGGARCLVNTRTWPGRQYGPFLLEASHDLDLALWLGAPAQVQRIDRHASGSDIIALGRDWSVEMADGARDYYRAWFVNGDFDTGANVRFHSPDELGDQMYIDELAHFLDCVREHKPTICPLSDGLRVLEVCAQVEAMCRS